MAWTHDDGDSPWWGLENKPADADPIALVAYEVYEVMLEIGIAMSLGRGSEAMTSLAEKGVVVDGASLVYAEMARLPMGARFIEYQGARYEAPDWFRLLLNDPRLVLLVVDTDDGREGWLIWLGKDPDMFEHFETLDWDGEET